MKKIGIIGSGIAAKMLATGLSRHGYSVMLGSGDKDKREKLNQETGLQTGSFEEAALFGDLVILAVKGTAAKKLFQLSKGSFQVRQ